MILAGSEASELSLGASCERVLFPFFVPVIRFLQSPYGQGGGSGGIDVHDRSDGEAQLM
jgi:hypothetical protein